MYTIQWHIGNTWRLCLELGLRMRACRRIWLKLWRKWRRFRRKLREIRDFWRKMIIWWWLGNVRILHLREKGRLQLVWMCEAHQHLQLIENQQKHAPPLQPSKKPEAQEKANSIKHTQAPLEKQQQVLHST